LAGEDVEVHGWGGGLGIGGEGEIELGVAEEVEGATVVGCGAVLGDGGAVLTGGVACVVLPAVLGVLLGEVVHVVVAIGLGEDAGCGDGEVFGVAFYDGLVGEVVVGLEAVAVDDEGLGTEGELVECAVHGEDAGAQDVDLVDFFGGDDSYGPVEGVVLDFGAEVVTLCGGELFGVVEAWVLVVFGEDDGCGIDASCEAAASGFVATGFDEVGVIVGE